jgi:predicted ATPase
MTDKELQEEINSLYKRISRNNKSAKFYKCDLHIHTPASKDYIKCNLENDDTNEYKLLIENFINSDVDIIAITDHNTCKGYYEIKKIFDDNIELKNKLGSKIILPGVEITCYGKHFLAIFHQNYLEDKLNALLMETGIDVDEQGTATASADRLSPLMLCEKVEEYGGIVIIAHADAENGLLQGYFKQRNLEESEMRGRSVQKILKSSSVHGICYNSEINSEKLNDILKSFNITNISILKASDSHSSLDKYIGSGLPLGNRASWIKMGKSSYNALKLALKDGKSRVLNYLPSIKENPYIIGLCVNGGFLADKNGTDWLIIPFAEELNCIIGARGTGKSTIIDILKFILNPENEDIGNSILGRFDKAVAFIRNTESVFAIRINPESVNKINRTFYQIRGNSFKKISKNTKITSLLENESDEVAISEYLNSAEVQGFRQKDILELAKMRFGPTAVIRSLCALLFKEEFDKLNKEYNLLKSGLTIQCKQLIKERKSDPNADLSSELFDNQYTGFIEVQSKLVNIMEETIKKINVSLKGELKVTHKIEIADEVIEEIIEEWTNQYRYQENASYSYIVQYRKLFANLFKKAKYDNMIMYKLFTHKVEDIAEEYALPHEIADRLCRFCYRKMRYTDVIIIPQVIADYELNVAHGISNKAIYIQRDNLSYGQRAVGMLLLVLTGATNLGENRTLVIDQPEDDLDNSYIYHTLVNEFKKIKKSRQLIIATHNPNIPITGDAENILILNSNGMNGWIELSGNIDNDKVSGRVLQILEGDIEAFIKRAEKYGYKVIKEIN